MSLPSKIPTSPSWQEAEVLRPNANLPFASILVMVFPRTNAPPAIISNWPLIKALLKRNLFLEFSFTNMKAKENLR
jgi:hypothetical protein